jgi:very-short-patch-repair endonuclease
MSLPEVLLWCALRSSPDGYKIRRQHPIGGYVADFACLSARLLIEVDGEAHARGNQMHVDRLRQSDLEALGFKVVRVPAREVLDDVESVVRMIVAECLARTPLHQPAAGSPPRSGEDFR